MRFQVAAAAVLGVLSSVCAAAAGDATAKQSTVDAPRFHMDLLQARKRYRWIGDESWDYRGVSQYKLSFQARVNLDRRGLWSLHAGIFTGAAFTSGYNATGIGNGKPQGSLSLKRLYLEVRPVSRLRLQSGSIPFERGASTEATTYDNDGYLTGHRIAFDGAGPFTSVSWTSAFLGEFQTPSSLRRLDRLAKANYHQLSLSRQWNDRIFASFDYTFEGGRDTLRMALRIDSPGLPWLGSFRWEAYQRLDPDSAFGFAASIDKARGPVRLQVGYSDIDLGYGTLNGSRYRTGQRIFTSLRCRLAPGLTAVLGTTHAVADRHLVSNPSRFDAVLSFDLLEALRR